MLASSTMAPNKMQNTALDEFRTKFKEIGGPTKVAVGRDDILFDLVSLVGTINAMKKQWQIEALQRASRIAELHEKFDPTVDAKRVSTAIRNVIEKIEKNEDVENAS